MKVSRMYERRMAEVDGDLAKIKLAVRHFWVLVAALGELSRLFNAALLSKWVAGATVESIVEELRGDVLKDFDVARYGTEFRAVKERAVEEMGTQEFRDYVRRYLDVLVIGAACGEEENEAFLSHHAARR